MIQSYLLKQVDSITWSRLKILSSFGGGTLNQLIVEGIELLLEKKWTPELRAVELNNFPERREAQPLPIPAGFNADQD